MAILFLKRNSRDWLLNAWIYKPDSKNVCFTLMTMALQIASLQPFLDFEYFSGGSSELGF